jgi:hypothetical protein
MQIADMKVAVASVDAAPVLAATKAVSDLVTFARDARFGTGRDSVAGLVGVVSLVAEKDFGGWEIVDYQSGLFEVAHLAFAEQHDGQPAPTVEDHPRLAVLATVGEPAGRVWLLGDDPSIAAMSSLRLVDGAAIVLEVDDPLDELFERKHRFQAVDARLSTEFNND